MKYFTPELLSKPVGISKREHDLAQAEWNSICEEYSKIFDTIKKRIPKMFLQIYFDNKGFNDFKLLSFGLSQITAEKKNPQSVHIDIETPYDSRCQPKQFRIIYKHPTKFGVQYQGKIPCNGFDDWSYCEFLPVDKHTLSHEIIFTSGATILTHFKDKNISIKQL